MQLKEKITTPYLNKDIYDIDLSDTSVGLISDIKNGGAR